MVSHLVKAVALAAAAQAFLLPGIAPHDYQPGERVWLKVNSLTSSKTQVPYEYYRVRSNPPRATPRDGQRRARGRNLRRALFGKTQVRRRYPSALFIPGEQERRARE